MVALVGAFCTMLIFAGGMVSCHEFSLGLLCAAPGIVTLDALFAYVQFGGTQYHGTNSDEGLTVKRLQEVLKRLHANTRIYVAAPTMKAADGMYQCRYDGGSAFVIEAQAERKDG